MGTCEETSAERAARLLQFLPRLREGDIHTPASARTGQLGGGEERSCRS